MEPLRKCHWKTFVGCAGGKLSKVRTKPAAKKKILVHVSVCAVFSEELLSAFHISTSKDCPEIHPQCFVSSVT